MPVMKTYIAGAPYHEGTRDAIAKLRRADELVLVREPSNPHDRNAVAVHAADGTKLGYVPRVDAGAIDEAAGTATVELLDAPRAEGEPKIEPAHPASTTRH